MTRKPPRLGTRVKDRETSKTGSVVHIYDDPKIRDEIVAVLFDDESVPLAVHVDDLARLPIKRRGRPA